MRKYILLLFVLYNLTVVAQKLGTWTAYPAYQNATMNIPAGNKIYSLCNGNLFSYNTETTEIYEYNKVKQLSDSKIEYINYSTTDKKIILVYKNGNIDIITPEDRIINLPQYKDKSLVNKKINNTIVNGENAYLSTNFGVVVINLKKEEFVNTYDIGKVVNSCTYHNQIIYAATTEGIYTGDTRKNLLDKKNWIKANNFVALQLTTFDNTLYALVEKNGLYKINSENMNPVKVASAAFTYMNISNNVMTVGNKNRILIFHQQNENYDMTQNNEFVSLSYGSGIYWASQGLKGLQAYKLNKESQKLEATPIVLQPNSPVRDYFQYMKYEGNRLLVAGGRYNYSNINYEGTVMYYEDNKWANFQEENISNITTIPYHNVTTIAQDPRDASHHFVSSARNGLYEFKNGKFVKHYTYTNSGLQTILPNSAWPLQYVSVSGLQYDKDNNLWMLNNEIDTIIKIMKPNGTWTKLYYEGLAGAVTCDYIMFDSKNRVWINARRNKNRGIFCLDINGTLEKQSDDKYKLRSEIINQDGVNYSPDYFYCITEDKEGQIWIGTNLGPFVITQPDQFMTDNFTYTQIKIPRNDGSNFADYLLSNIVITTIAVDGANRKWIGTDGNGIYLISANGQETIHHFTTENSPLLSNKVEWVVTNNNTGEVMIGTDAGLISYASDAVDAQETLEKDNIYAYPNPVKPDYEGPITITGLTYNCEIKITTATGQLIHSGVSTGGRYSWNGRNAQGKRVASGIYNVLASTSDGKEAIVTKIAMIR